MNYDTISKRSGPPQQTPLRFRDFITTLRYSCEQILKSSAAHFLDLTGTLRKKGMSYWVALSEFFEISRLVSSFKEDMPATWVEASLRRHIFWTAFAAATTTPYIYCDNILSHARKPKAMAKSPNFLLQTTVPWERISLRHDLFNELGPVFFGTKVS
jgi:hypothetical protein